MPPQAPGEGFSELMRRSVPLGEPGIASPQTT
jgi:hypothetical protein